MSLGEQYFFFLKIGKFFPIIAIIAEILQIEPWLMLNLGRRYWDAEDAVAHPRPLVSGHDLIQKLNLAPSPMIGKILMEIQLAQIEGRVTTFAEALRLALELSRRDF
jgi:tRNA nucleotidyltransferase (CCA-adding enzyme)